MKRGWLFLTAAMLAGCGGGTAPPVYSASHIPVPQAPSAVSAPVSAAGVGGQTASALIARFGPPRIDLQEGTARKLQFAGPACVLDVYLYPRGRGEPVATHLDTRLRDGRATDPASCMAMLRRTPAP